MWHQSSSPFIILCRCLCSHTQQRISTLITKHPQKWKIKFTINVVLKALAVQDKQVDFSLLILLFSDRCFSPSIVLRDKKSCSVLSLIEFFKTVTMLCPNFTYRNCLFPNSSVFNNNRKRWIEMKCFVYNQA